MRPGAMRILAEFDRMMENKTGFVPMLCKKCGEVVRLDETCSNPNCVDHNKTPKEFKL